MNRPVILTAAAVLTLTLAACNTQSTGSTPAPAPAPVGGSAITSIRGIVTSPIGGAGSVALASDQALPVSASNPALSSTALGANGNFTLPLPSAAALGTLLKASGVSDIVPSNSGTCTGSATNSDPTSLSYGLGTLQANGQEIVSASVSSSGNSATFSAKLWAYESKATTFSGTINCTNYANGVTTRQTAVYNAALKPGWNILTVSLTLTLTSNTTESVTVNVGTADDGASAWTTASGLGLQALSGPQARAQALGRETLNALKF